MGRTLVHVDKSQQLMNLQLLEYEVIVGLFFLHPQSIDMFLEKINIKTAVFHRFVSIYNHTRVKRSRVTFS
jgi:hypothetical protein